MSKENIAEAARRPATVSVPIRMPVALNDSVEDASEELGLSKQDVIRLSIERGVVILKNQLHPPAQKAA